VPRLLIGPSLIMLAAATVYDPEQSAAFRLFRAGLLVATILLHGALLTSVGLALATWIKGQSRAIAVSVTVFVLVAIAWPIVAFTAGSWRHSSGLAALSPITVVALVTDNGTIRGDVGHFHLWVAFWDVMVGYGAIGLLLLTIRSFDSCFGRTGDHVHRSPFIAALVRFFVGGITLACVAGAIATWVALLEPSSMHSEDWFALLVATFTIMTVLSMLAAVATGKSLTDKFASWHATRWECWWRACRFTVALTLGPALLSLALATARAIPAQTAAPTAMDALRAYGPSNASYRLLIVLLLAATIIVQGALISALSMFLYSWTNRRDRSIAFGAGLFWAAAIGWPLFLWYSGLLDITQGRSMLSFPVVTILLAAELISREPQVSGLFAWAAFRIIILTFVTFGLLWRITRTSQTRIAQLPLRIDSAEFATGSQPVRPTLPSVVLHYEPE
jgi:hypothetical protein